LPLKGKILNVEKARFDKMLSSVEVGTLITALGCGIGRDEFDPDKLRYHRIIIMTDADVDGAHIRTLLLTFFFRHMPELIERGHLLIAQPPLYKMKRGKSERYIKDEAELTRYLLEVALEDASLDRGNGEEVSGDELRDLAERYYTILTMMKRLERVYPLPVLGEMIYLPGLTPEQLKEQTEVQMWTEQLETKLSPFNTPRIQYEVTVKEDLDRHLYYPHVTTVRNGVRRHYALNRDFFSSADYQAFAGFQARIDGLVQENGQVRKGEKSESVAGLAEALTWLQTEALRGQSRQRYKGLGEMNPDQLWETTMDPRSRTMLRVTIEDAIAADQVFTTLMGDQVEPRREFIEQNALAVANLDV
jgi:DNA gyrase subunit B